MEGLIDFVRSIQLDLVFTLNASPQQRDSQLRWRGDSAENLLRYASSHDDPISVIEFGNEINGYWFDHGFLRQPSGSVIADDLKLLRSLVKRYRPDSRIAGPGEYFWPRLGSPFASQTRVLTELIANDRGNNLDFITWHYYPQQSRRCPLATRRATLTELLQPASLDEIVRWAEQVGTLRDKYSPHSRVWLGETGSAQCGGEPGVSDRYVSSLWWMDQLGLLATHNHAVVVRQALVGSDYGLLNDRTWEPRPDYFASLLHKRLMGQVVLDVQRDADSDPYLRVYAHCSHATVRGSRGSVTVLAINLHQHEHAVLKWPHATGRRVDRYQVTASALESSSIALNGHRVDSTGAAIALEPERLLQFDGTYTLPPVSYVFLVADIEAAACAAEPRGV